jgi:hypothetical protein
MLADLKSDHYKPKKAASGPGGDVCRCLYKDK